jgi:hypothetical protein
MRISIFSSKELQAVLLAMRSLDKDLAKQLRQQTKAVVGPEWTKAVRENAQTRLEQRVLADTARVAVSNQNITLKSAGVGRRLSGGLLPKESAYAIEFGADRFAPGQGRTYQSTSKRGNKYTIHNRNTVGQLRPRNKKGYVVYPAIAEVVPRIASLWVQTVMRGVHEAFESR